MSIIIAKKELPKCCALCLFDKSSLWCSITKSDIDRNYEHKERLNDCPLKSVERLIEEINNIDPWNTEEKAMKYAIAEFIKKYCEVSENAESEE